MHWKGRHGFKDCTNLNACGEEVRNTKNYGKVASFIGDKFLMPLLEYYLVNTVEGHLKEAYQVLDYVFLGSLLAENLASSFVTVSAWPLTLFSNYMCAKVYM